MISTLRRYPRSVGARPSTVSTLVSVLVSALAIGGAGGANAATADSPMAVSSVPAVQRGAAGRQMWRLSDYTTVELVALERGAAPNGHPWQVEPGALRQQLQQLKIVRAGADRPLFASEELNMLVPALVEALGNARPDQDVALVSAARHEDNTFLALSAVTARLFVVDGRLNIIVHDARLDFYDTARGTGVAPNFTIGSRKSSGGTPILGAGATGVRADWLALSPASSSAPVAPVVAPVGAPVAAGVVSAPAALAPAAQPVPMAPPAAVDPSAAAEQRLQTLKRLFDKGLITESEYKQKRQEILKSL